MEINFEPATDEGTLKKKAWMEEHYVNFINNDLREATQEEIISRLTKAGIKEGSGEIWEYQLAKKILFHGRWIDSVIHDRVLAYAITYIGM